MRKLPAEKRAAILSALVEGMSVNATARMTGCSKITVLRLLADVGEFCFDFHDRMVRGLQSERIEADELWSFCGCKAVTKRRGGQGHGDAWVWIAMDSDTKLVISWSVGDRSSAMADALMKDLARRVESTPQITTDALAAYRFSIRGAFHERASHAVVHKTYAGVVGEGGRYSPPQCTSCTKEAAFGSPDLGTATTSFVERQNLSVRMGSRRFTRLTNGFSKRIENHAYALAIHYVHANFIRKHGTLKTAPAVAAGLIARPMTLLELVGMVEAVEAERGGRLTAYLPAVVSK